MKFLLKWFSSLKLTVWALTLLIGVFFLGAYVMPIYPKAHEGMNAMPLFEWWSTSGKDFPAINAWLPISVFLLAVLTLNTLVCTIRSLRLSPSIWAHLTHIGFLLILLAHLLSASTGFKESNILLPRGHVVEVPRLNIQLKLENINYVPYPGGMPKTYSAEVTLIDKDKKIRKLLGPNQPAFYDGIPIYLKNFGFRPVPYAVCEIADDPGAMVAFIGSLIFLAGSLPLPFLVKWRGRNRREDEIVD
jgi:hypothetical protein